MWPSDETQIVQQTQLIQLLQQQIQIQNIIIEQHHQLQLLIQQLHQQQPRVTPAIQAPAVGLTTTTTTARVHIPYKYEKNMVQSINKPQQVVDNELLLLPHLGLLIYANHDDLLCQLRCT